MPDKANATVDAVSLLKKLAPLNICDSMADFPGKSERVCIVGWYDENPVLLAENLMRPFACMLVAAFNEKYGEHNNAKA